MQWFLNKIASIFGSNPQKKKLKLLFACFSVDFQLYFQIPEAVFIIWIWEQKKIKISKIIG